MKQNLISDSHIFKNPKRLHFVLSILWIGVIWGHSMMPGSLSSNESGLIFTILHSIFPFLTHHIVRKLGHFSEYCLLGILMDKKWKPHPIFLCWMVAFLDETIQIFSTGRAAMIQDVWIDVAGAALGIVISLIVIMIFFRSKDELGDL